MTDKRTERLGLLSLHLFFSELDLAEQVFYLLRFVANKHCLNRLAEVLHHHQFHLNESLYDIWPFPFGKVSSGFGQVPVRGASRLLGDFVVLVLSRCLFILLANYFF